MAIDKSLAQAPQGLDQLNPLDPSMQDEAWKKYFSVPLVSSLDTIYGVSPVFES